jgi:hypothetical protein
LRVYFGLPGEEDGCEDRDPLPPPPLKRGAEGGL